MKALGDELLRIVASSEAPLRQVSEPDSEKPALPGGWSRKQVLGHLIDSASNNHQRFVRAATQDSLTFPGYDQTALVQVEAVQEAGWETLVALWASYNRYLAHVIAHLPPSKLDVPCTIGAGAPVTLRFLAEDYVRHMVHHLGQIGVSSEASLSA